jgi:hypothetical protein
MPDDLKRRRGRPPLDPTGAKSTQLSVHLTDADYFVTARIARERRESMQDLIRRGLRHELERLTRQP